jgi:hypothetical protein
MKKEEDGSREELTISKIERLFAGSRMWIILGKESGSLRREGGKRTWKKEVKEQRK